MFRVLPIVIGVQLAHPLTGSPPLPVPPLVLAAGAVVLAAVVATRVRAAGHPRPGAAPTGTAVPGEAGAGAVAPPGAGSPGGAAGGADATAEREPRWLWVPRLLSTAAFLLLLVEARRGPVEEPRNLAAVTVVHLLWPLALVASALLGPLLWRAVDPMRGLVAALDRLWGPPAPRPAAGPVDAGNAPGGAPGSAGADGPAAASAPSADAATAPVWPAVVTGGGWALFLALYAVSVEPRALGAFLAAYVVVTVAGCIAFGAARWLATGHGAGLVVAWTGLLRRGRLVAWAPPPGAAALLGAVFGGLAFGRLRLTSVWGDVATSADAERWHRVGAVAAVVLGAGLAHLAERWAGRRGAPGSVAAALVPVVAAVAVGSVLRRTMVAAQLATTLTPGLSWLWDPLGLGDAVDLNPWGTAVQQALAVGVVALGGLAGAWVLARRVRGVRSRDPAAYTVYVTTFAAAFLVAVR